MIICHPPKNVKDFFVHFQNKTQIPLSPHHTAPVMRACPAISPASLPHYIIIPHLILTFTVNFFRQESALHEHYSPFIPYFDKIGHFLTLSNPLSIRFLTYPQSYPQVIHIRATTHEGLRVKPAMTRGRVFSVRNRVIDRRNPAIISFPQSKNPFAEGFLVGEIFR